MMQYWLKRPEIDLNSLIYLAFMSVHTIDQEFITKLFDLISYLKDFNFDLFKNLSNQLEEIMIYFSNIYYTTLDKLFDCSSFPYLLYFSIRKCNMKRLKKERVYQSFSNTKTIMYNELILLFWREIHLILLRIHFQMLRTFEK